MVKLFLSHYSGRGAIMLLQPFRFVYWPKPMSKPTTYSKSCTSLVIPRVMYDLIDFSAELEMTVNMLIQIDKLVQLLESPVFTCTLLLVETYGDTDFCRPPTSTS
jgi:hypothetical protein